MFNFFKKSKKEQNETLSQSVIDSEKIPQQIINDLQELQQEYKEKNEKWFLEAKNNREIATILGNFFDKVPDSLWAVFTLNSYCHLFEYLLSKDYDEVRKTLWSSDDDLNAIKKCYEDGNIPLDARTASQETTNYMLSTLRRPYQNSQTSTSTSVINQKMIGEVESFIAGDFAKLIKLFKKIVVYENEYDYTFVLLKLLQIGAASYFSQIFDSHYKIDFGDIDIISLEECSFIYFKQGDVFDEPKISFFTYHMINNEKFGDVENIDYFNFLNRKQQIIQLINDKKEELEYRLFEDSITKKAFKVKPGYSIQDIDLMSGTEFEEFVAKIFTKMGYITKVTKQSGDFGVDVIAEKDGIKTGIQAKCYTGSVSNSAIQEIEAGIKYYNCHKGVVVTNSKFTKAAIELAKSNNIQLWDRKVLEEKLPEIFRDE